MVRLRIKRSLGETLFTYFNYSFLMLFGFLMLLPFLSVLAISLSSSSAVNLGKVSIFPVDFTTASWQYILKLERLWRSLGLTLLITIVGTFLSLIVNSLMAYPLSKKEFPPSKFILLLVAATMIFKAPVIPYFLVVKSLGLFDNIWVLIVPSLIGSYYLIIMVTFIRQIPKELEESAIIDGCGYLRILFSIILPSSKAMLATIGLFYAVSYWGQFMHPLLFIQNYKLFPIQLTIRAFIIGDELVAELVTEERVKRLYNQETVKNAVTIFCMLPIMLSYPYLQKYFIKGAMIGSIKG